MYHEDLRPLDYPWIATDHSILLTKSGEYSIKMTPGEQLAEATVVYDEGFELPLALLLEQENAISLEKRVPVVAIGSNASPLVTKSKFSRYGSKGINQTTPMLPATMKNIGVGYSGHFVGGGYIPAAPFHELGAETKVVVAYLSREQLRAIDNTEPTYKRISVTKENYPVTLENGEVLETAYIYASYFGIIHDRYDQPIEMTTQSNLFRILNNNGFGDGFFAGEAKIVSDRISGKSRWIRHPKVNADDILDDITAEDGIIGVEDTPKLSKQYKKWYEDDPTSKYGKDVSYSRDDSEWENSIVTPTNADFDPWWIERDFSDHSINRYDFEDLSDEEMFGEFADQSLDDAWLNQKDFDADYDCWWNTDDKKVNRF